jgi:hypothetical protein
LSIASISNLCQHVENTIFKFYGHGTFSRFKKFKKKSKRRHRSSPLYLLQCTFCLTTAADEEMTPPVETRRKSGSTRTKKPISMHDVLDSGVDVSGIHNGCILP